MTRWSKRINEIAERKKRTKVRVVIDPKHDPASTTFVEFDLVLQWSSVKRLLDLVIELLKESEND